MKREFVELTEQQKQRHAEIREASEAEKQELSDRDKSERTIPANAYGMHAWQLDAWESMSHPDCLAGWKVVRCEIGNYDGYIQPLGMESSVYVLGWLKGRESVAG